MFDCNNKLKSFLNFRELSRIKNFMKFFSIYDDNPTYLKCFVLGVQCLALIIQCNLKKIINFHFSVTNVKGVPFAGLVYVKPNYTYGWIHLAYLLFKSGKDLLFLRNEKHGKNYWKFETFCP